MAELSGSPVTVAIRKMLRDPVVLSSVRSALEDAEATGLRTPQETAPYLEIVESIEREIADEQSTGSN